jgi:hypothetical protein
MARSSKKREGLNVRPHGGIAISGPSRHNLRKENERIPAELKINMAEVFGTHRPLDHIGQRLAVEIDVQSLQCNFVDLPTH